MCVEQLCAKRERLVPDPARLANGLQLPLRLHTAADAVDAIN